MGTGDNRLKRRINRGSLETHKYLQNSVVPESWGREMEEGHRGREGIHWLSASLPWAFCLCLSLGCITTITLLIPQVGWQNRLQNSKFCHLQTRHSQPVCMEKHSNTLIWDQIAWETKQSWHSRLMHGLYGTHVCRCSNILEEPQTDKTEKSIAVADLRYQHPFRKEQEMIHYKFKHLLWIHFHLNYTQVTC